MLAIDTSTAQVGVALGSDEGVVGQIRLVQGRRHAEQLTPAISNLLEQAGAATDDLAVIGVGIGPGLFTGLRVGVTTAKVMAQALRIPVVPVPSLDLVAYPVRFTDRLIAAVIDARRGEVFRALYRPVPGGIQRLGEYEVTAPQDLAAELVATGSDLLLVGDGALQYRDRLGDLDRADWASPAFSHPSPAALLELACARYRREEFCRPQEVVPLYLRKTDADINWPSRTGAR